MKAGDVITGEWIVKGSEKNHRHFVQNILKDPTVKAFEF
jgi:putative Mg2+ transporter-C (MgtC) family protein